MAFYGAALVLVLAAVVALQIRARRPMVIARPSLGGPPPSRKVPQLPKLLGKPAATFAARDVSGQPVGTDASRGRVMVVNIWATWCRPCVDEMPQLEQEIWQRFQPDVALIAVATGENARKVRAFRERAKVTFPLVPDPRDEITRRFGGHGLIPRTYVINRSGVIVYETFGYSGHSVADLAAAVEKAVAER